MLKEQLRLPNQCTPSPDLLTCGMPNAQDLQNAQKAGFKTIINLCPTQETPREEPAAVVSLGMQYFNIPVAGPGDLNEANARQLGEIINNCDHHPVLIHCMSGNRVGALIALKAFFVDGKQPREALNEGLAAGLKALEPAVWQLLNHHAANA